MPEKTAYHPEYLRRRIKEDFQRLREAGWDPEALALLAMKCVPELKRPKAKRKNLARSHHQWPLPTLCEMIIAKYLGWDNETVSAFCGKHPEAIKSKWTQVRHGLSITNEWTPEQESLLIALHARGLTFTQIGVQLGRTKNSIAGKVRDLRYARRIPKTRAGLTGKRVSFGSTSG